MAKDFNPHEKTLRDNGFTDGWVLCDDKLILWEHDENPPAPLKRPE